MNLLFLTRIIALAAPFVGSALGFLWAGLSGFIMGTVIGAFVGGILEGVVRGYSDDDDF